jgi:hypothetical protein
MASKKDSAIPGLWHITSMDLWDEEYINEAVQAYLRFDSSQSGEFQFGYVFGQIDYRLTERGGRPAAEWSWEGNDEMDERSGRRWAVLNQDGALTGRIFLHDGDDSAFVAKRAAGPIKRKRR